MKVNSKTEQWIQIQGGLGNQLFQYAFAHHFAKSSNSDLILDCEFMSRAQSGNGILDFNLEGKFVNLDSVWEKKVKRALKIYKPSKPPNEYPRIDERLSKNLKFSNLNGSNYFTGYFRSYEFARNFLAGNKLVLRSPSNEYMDLSGKIYVEGIAMHVRRGDYKKNTSWGQLSPKYYAEALSIMRQNSSEKIYIYSDEPNFVKKEFFADSVFSNCISKDEIIIIDDKLKLTAAETMLLLASTNRIIIGNSTFSLWAAYLSKNADVVAPSRFYANFNPVGEIIYGLNWKKIIPHYV